MLCGQTEPARGDTRPPLPKGLLRLVVEEGVDVFARRLAACGADIVLARAQVVEDDLRGA